MAEDYLSRILNLMQPEGDGNVYKSQYHVQQSSTLLHTAVYALGSLSEDNEVPISNTPDVHVPNMHIVSLT